MTGWEALTDAERDQYRARWKRDASAARLKRGEVNGRLAEVNRRRAEDWEATIGGYAVLGYRRPDPAPAPRPNGFTPRPTSMRRMVAREVAHAKLNRDADIDRDLEASMARLKKQSG